VTSLLTYKYSLPVQPFFQFPQEICIVIIICMLYMYAKQTTMMLNMINVTPVVR